MLEMIFELGINAVEELIIIDFVSRYLGFRYNDKRRVIGFIIGWLVSFAEVTIMNYVTFFEGFAVFIPVLIVFVYALVFLKGSWLLKLWISVLTEIIVVAVGIGINLFVSYIIDYDPVKVMTVFNAPRIIIVVLAQLILFYVTRLVLRFKYRNPIDKNFWFMLIVIPVISIISLVSMMLAAMRFNEISGYMICGMSGIVLANIAMYYFYIAINKEYEARITLKAMEQKEEYDRRHAKDIEELYAKTCAIRHDMLNHFTAIKGLLDEDSGKAREYVRSVTQGEIQSIRPLIRTDNSSFDAIANAKLAVCESNGINVSTRIMDGALGRLTDYEIASLFGNLFDNAIDASKNSEGKRIELDVCVQKDQLSIFMRNTIDSSVLEGNSGLKTTKANKELHGLGTKNIKRIVDKHNGIINYFEEDGYFCCDILM